MSGERVEIVSEIDRARRQLLQSFDYIYEFGGFGHLEVDMKILKRGQKEVLIRCGREYRFVLDTCDVSIRRPSADAGNGSE